MGNMLYRVRQKRFTLASYSGRMQHIPIFLLFKMYGPKREDARVARGELRK